MHATKWTTQPFNLGHMDRQSGAAGGKVALLRDCLFLPTSFGCGYCLEVRPSGVLVCSSADRHTQHTWDPLNQSTRMDMDQDI